MALIFTAPLRGQNVTRGLTVFFTVFFLTVYKSNNPSSQLSSLVAGLSFQTRLPMEIEREGNFES